MLFQLFWFIEQDNKTKIEKTVRSRKIFPRSRIFVILVVKI